MKKVKATHQTKGKPYKVAKSATFSGGKKQVPDHMTHNAGSKRKK